MKKNKLYKVLVIDDEREFCDLVESSLESSELEIRTAYDGEEAVAIINQRKFDLILMDCEMPGISGVELAKKIRKDRQNLDKPKLVMITGYNGIRESFTKKMGVDAYLEKPVQIKQIKEMVQAFHKGANLS